MRNIPVFKSKAILFWEGNIMKIKNRWTMVMTGMLALAPLSFAKDADKQKRSKTVYEMPIRS